jgi:uncharacterized protein (TIGR00288 family)
VKVLLKQYASDKLFEGYSEQGFIYIGGRMTRCLHGCGSMTYYNHNIDVIALMTSDVIFKYYQ